MPQIMERSLYFTRVSSQEEGWKLKDLVMQAFGLKKEDIAVGLLKPEHRVIINRVEWAKKEAGKTVPATKLSSFSDCEWGVYFVNSCNPVDKAQRIVRQAEVIIGKPIMDPKKSEDTVEVLSRFIEIQKLSNQLSTCLK